MKKVIQFIFVLTFFKCSSPFQLSLDKELTTKIQSKYLEKKVPVDLTKITNFKWDNYLFINTYETPKQLEKKYNVDLSNISKYIAADEMKKILVFLKNKKAIKICNLEGNILIKKNKYLEIK